jgi:hypothetical protein
MLWWWVCSQQTAEAGKGAPELELQNPSSRLNSANNFLLILMVWLSRSIKFLSFILLWKVNILNPTYLFHKFSWWSWNREKLNKQWLIIIILFKKSLNRLVLKRPNISNSYLVDQLTASNFMTISEIMFYVLGIQGIRHSPSLLLAHKNWLKEGDSQGEMITCYCSLSWW